MPDRECDLCGWPIEEWQRADSEHVFVPERDARVLVSVHANPADHKPTRRPEVEDENLQGEKNFVDGMKAWI